MPGNNFFAVNMRKYLNENKDDYSVILHLQSSQ